MLSAHPSTARIVGQKTDLTGSISSKSPFLFKKFVEAPSYNSQSLGQLTHKPEEIRWIARLPPSE
jgi:hypothetical protein